MHDALQFVTRHGYAVLFVWTLAEQIGLAIPSLPIMLAAGALAGKGEFNLALAVIAASVAALIADNLWYQLGRTRGKRILRTLCRISIEPDSCVRRTEDFFARYGASSLLFAKFVPGLGTVAVPLAGASRMKLWRFLALDALGALIWSGAFIGFGDAFSNQLERLAVYGISLGAALGALLVVAAGAWLGWKLYRRRGFLRQIESSRVTPEEVKERMDKGEEVFIVDLRHQLDFETSPAVIPGAVHVDPAELGKDALRIPREREIVLYCT